MVIWLKLSLVWASHVFQALRNKGVKITLFSMKDSMAAIIQQDKYDFMAIAAQKMDV